jgi:hypothetical protein
VRRLRDIDFIAASFDSIPAAIGSELLLRHVHPHDLPGKNMLQGVDQEAGVRVDVFRAYGLGMERTSPIEIALLGVRLVSLHDLVARHARLNWDLVQDKRRAEIRTRFPAACRFSSNRGGRIRLAGAPEISESRELRGDSARAATRHCVTIGPANSSNLLNEPARTMSAMPGRGIVSPRRCKPDIFDSRLLLKPVEHRTDLRARVAPRSLLCSNTRDSRPAITSSCKVNR